MPLTHLEYEQIVTAITTMRGTHIDNNKVVYVADLKLTLLRFTEGYEPPNPHPEREKKPEGPGAQRSKP